jgi:hypothetical protein
VDAFKSVYVFESVMIWVQNNFVGCFYIHLGQLNMSNKMGRAQYKMKLAEHNTKK